jgi:hypothetical protein
MLGRFWYVDIPFGVESCLDGLIRGWLVGGWSMGGYVQPICIFFYNPLHPIIFFDFLDYGLDFFDNGLDNADNSLDKVDKVLDYDDFLLGLFAFFVCRLESATRNYFF